MGFRFRKSISMGPFRVNFSKSGIGWSVGGKGYRYTKKAGGGSRSTYSIPGTGLSYVKDASQNTANKRKNTTTPENITFKESFQPLIELKNTISNDLNSGKYSKKRLAMGCGMLLLLLLIIPISFCGSCSDESSNVSESDIFTLSESDVISSTDSVVRNTTSTEFFTTTLATTTTTTAGNVEMVWVSHTGTKYHSNPNCSDMVNPSQIPLEAAEAKGLKPCSKCY